MAIITYPLNNIEYDASDAETYLCTRTSGVYSAENMFALSLGESRSVNISGGIAWINNGDYKGKSIVSTETTALTIAPSDAQQSRIDLIVLRFDASSNQSSFVVKQGALATNPEAPLVTKTEEVYELGLYLVTVPSGSSVITSSNITSVMLDEAYCGIMRDGVTGIPTQQLVDKFNELLDKLTEEYESATSTINGKLDKTGGTLTGAVTAHTGSDYTTYRLRNIALKTTAETPLNGSLLGVYEA